VDFQEAPTKNTKIDLRLIGKLPRRIWNILLRQFLIHRKRETKDNELLHYSKKDDVISFVQFQNFFLRKKG
jgi:hypothetical protein